MNINRSTTIINPNIKRVMFRPFVPGLPQKALRIINTIYALSEQDVENILKQVLIEFEERHLKIEQFFLKRFMEICFNYGVDKNISLNRQLLTGAYFTHEYTLEASALFNPSIVWDIDQKGLPEGSKRFILSLRSTGEGHISSVSFRSGILDKNNNISIDKCSKFVSVPDAFPNRSYSKKMFETKTRELGISNSFTDQFFTGFPDEFSLTELIDKTQAQLSSLENNKDAQSTSKALIDLAQCNYEVVYSDDVALSERVIFPFAPNESNGIEDARFVCFTDDSGEITYFATYTAYNGRMIFPQLLETKDFLHFKINTLNGHEVQNKGMALFPRKINGKYVMLSRQDNENLYIMFSDHIHFWREKQLLLTPEFSWELVQVGNCGSPLETPEGWLVITHGVGPLRKYCIGAVLLDLENPTKVIGRLKDPILSPDDNEREGYVPNVVYTCGAIIKGPDLILPYAMSDYCTGFATINVKELMKGFENSQ